MRSRLLLRLPLFAFLVLTLLFGAIAFGCGGDDDGRPGFTPDASGSGVDSGPGGGGDTGTVAVDSAAPGLTFNVATAQSIGTTRLTVTFDAPPNPTQATALTSYAAPGLTFSGAPTLDGNVVTLTTSQQTGIAYTLTVTGVTRASDAKPLTIATVNFVGRAPFNVTKAESPNSITVVVTFDAPPNDIQATTSANYNIPGLTIVGQPVLDGSAVTLTTSTQAAQSYTLTVSNVTRALDSEPLTNATATVTGTITFNVANAAATQNTVMRVTFDAPPNAAQAVVLSSYSVPGLTLSGTPVLSANVVTITTSPQNAQPYVLTVSGVTRASDGNPLATKTATFLGRASFNVQAASAAHASRVSVTFDAPPNNTQATDLASYSVPGLTLSAPQVVGSTVTFTTTLQSAGTFTVTVTGVTRASDGEPLTIASTTFAGRTPPTTINNLAGQPRTDVSVELTWTAPSQDAVLGTTTVAGYEIRVAQTPITTLAAFLAANAAPAPIPVAAGQLQTAIVPSLSPNTTYHFAVRAIDGGGNVGNISGDVAVTTKPHAKLLITEVAVANTDVEGYDFVESVVTVGGWAEGTQIKQLNTTLYTLGPIELVVGDRIVVHMTDLPGPVGFDQEDLSKNKTSSTAPFASLDAYDVYSGTSGLTGTDNLITVDEGVGTAIVDAVAISNRDNDAAAATLTAWNNMRTLNAWTFAVAPTDGVNDCQAQRDAVNIALNATDLACGGFATGFMKGLSINRVGTTDTNTKAEWYVAAQSPGAANVAPPVPTTLSAIATSTTSVELTFDHEITPSTVNTGAFTIAGLGVTAATLSNVHIVTLATNAQAGGTYQVDIANSVTATYGLSIVPAFARFCTFSTLPALVAINEVSPNLTSGPGLSTDLIELKVTRGGVLAGYQLRANPITTGTSGTLLATLPAICAAPNDIVVVHLTPASAPGAAPSSETTSKDQHPMGTFTANYDSAWDVHGGNTGIAFTSQVLAIRDAAGDYIEGAAFSDMSGGASTATYLNALAFIQAQGLWSPANCGGVACTDATTPTAKGVAASWVGVSSTLPSLPSVGRSNGGIDATSWVVGPSTFGL